jgi:hypothetical protein
MHRVNGYFRPARGASAPIGTRGQIRVTLPPVPPRPPTVRCEGCGGRGLVPADDPEWPGQALYGRCPECDGAGYR